MAGATEWAAGRMGERAACWVWQNLEVEVRGSPNLLYLLWTVHTPPVAVRMGAYVN